MERNGREGKKKGGGELLEFKEKYFFLVYSLITRKNKDFVFVF